MKKLTAAYQKMKQIWKSMYFTFLRKILLFFSQKKEVCFVNKDYEQILLETENDELN